MSYTTVNEVSWWRAPRALVMLCLSVVIPSMLAGEAGADERSFKSSDEVVSITTGIIRSCLGISLSKYPSLERFLVSKDGAVLYQGLKVEYVPRAANVVLSLNEDMKDGAAEEDVVTLSEMLPPSDFNQVQEQFYWHEVIKNYGFQLRPQAEAAQEANKLFHQLQTQLKNRKQEYATEHATVLQELKRTERDLQRLVNNSDRENGSGKLRRKSQSLQRALDGMEHIFADDRKAIRRHLMSLQGMTPDQIGQQEDIDEKHRGKLLHTDHPESSSSVHHVSHNRDGQGLTKLDQMRLQHAAANQDQSGDSAPLRVRTQEREELERYLGEMMAIDDEL